MLYFHTCLIWLVEEWKSNLAGNSTFNSISRHRCFECYQYDLLGTLPGWSQRRCLGFNCVWANCTGGEDIIILSVQSLCPFKILLFLFSLGNRRQPMVAVVISTHPDSRIDPSVLFQAWNREGTSGAFPFLHCINLSRSWFFQRLSHEIFICGWSF